MTNLNENALHFDHPITASADNLICYKINTVHLVCVTRKVRFNLVRLEIPNLYDSLRSISLAK